MKNHEKIMKNHEKHEKITKIKQNINKKMLNIDIMMIFFMRKKSYVQTFRTQSYQVLQNFDSTEVEL
jgi:hypothetical protein